MALEVASAAGFLPLDVVADVESGFCFGDFDAVTIAIVGVGNRDATHDHHPFINNIVN